MIILIQIVCFALSLLGCAVIVLFIVSIKEIKKGKSANKTIIVKKTVRFLELMSKQDIRETDSNSPIELEKQGSQKLLAEAAPKSSNKQNQEFTEEKPSPRQDITRSDEKKEPEPEKPKFSPRTLYFAEDDGGYFIKSESEPSDMSIYKAEETDPKTFKFTIISVPRMQSKDVKGTTEIKGEVSQTNAVDIKDQTPGVLKEKTDDGEVYWQVEKKITIKFSK